MGFLEKISERENAFLNGVRQMQGEIPLYIWGAARSGRHVAQLLEKEGLV